MKILKGDNVTIYKGRDKGKTGKIVAVYPKEGKIVVEGMNIKKRHVKPKKSGEKGQIVEVAGKIYSANVRIVCGSCKKNTRIRYEISEAGKSRICKKCSATI